MLIDVKAHAAKLKDISPERVETLVNLKNLVNKKQNAIRKNYRKLQSSYALLTFFSYKDTQTFLDKSEKYDDLLPTGTARVFKDFQYARDVMLAPDPYDIDWSTFSRPYSFNSILVNFFIKLFVFLVLPCITFYVHYSLSTRSSMPSPSAETKCPSSQATLSLSCVWQ